MPFRVTDSSSNVALAARIASGQQRLATVQERISSGKRINRPSDDPTGTETVLRLRTTQAALAQFQRNAGTARDKLLVSDGALDSYQQALDHAHTLLIQGASDPTPGDALNSVATQIEGVRQGLLTLVNTHSGGEYVFGGTRQTVPPFDPTTGALASAPTSEQTIQVEPDAPPVVVGVTGDAAFADANGTVFDALTQAAAALRGTGDPAADKANLRNAMARVKAFFDNANALRTRIGVGLNRVETAGTRLDGDNLLVESTAQRIEGADLAESALELTESQRTLEAIFQASSRVGRRSLIDFLG